MRYLTMVALYSVINIMRKAVALWALCPILIFSFSMRTHADDLIPKGLVKLADGGYFSPFAIVVDKTVRTLSVWRSERGKHTKVLEFPSDFGKAGGDKQYVGDLKTPESIYFFEKILTNPEIPFDKYGLKAFTMDYPNIFDRRAGKTGSGIWLHAIPDNETLSRGSKGCVVVRNDAIKQLTPLISLEKTPILIYDKVPLVSSDEQNLRKQKVENWLAQWKTAWQSKDIEHYMNFYSQDFRSQRMNWKNWKRFKTSLNKKYQEIDVQITNPVVFEHNGRWVIRTLQEYRSDLHKDNGEKTLYVQEENGELKIIAEQWQELDEKGNTQVAGSTPSATTATAN